MTTTTIQKWGNSSAVRIPRELAKQLDLQVGQTVALEAKDGKLVVRKSRPRPRVKLSELLAKCKGPNPHAEMWGDPVGREFGARPPKK